MNLDNHPDYFTADDPAPERPDEKVIRFEGAHDAVGQAPTVTTPEQPGRPRRRGRKIFFGSLLMILAVLAGVVWLRYFNPYETDMTSTGYITDFKRQGYIFKTWEGTMAIQNPATTPVDFHFSVENEAVAARLASYKDSGTLVRVSFRRFRGALPWRGASTEEVTSVIPVANTQPPARVID